jgi:L-iditol 2-dehydrogenase
MRACVLTDTRRFEVRELPQPVPGPHDVLLRVTAVGLCGTDFHIYAGHANYNTDERGAPIPLTVEPQILGHEVTGVVEEVGRNVHDVRRGDRVVIDQGLNCVSLRQANLCEYCATGNSHQCAFFREHGITGLPGGLAGFLVIPAVNAVRIESEIPPAQAALTEPLGCIVHSSEMASRGTLRYSIGATDVERRVRAVLICGAGPAGLLFTQYLRRVLNYDGVLLVAEPNPRRRELAAGFGAKVIDPVSTDLIEAVLDKTEGRRVEYLIEATGSGSVFASIPALIRKQATVLLYGHGHAGTDLSVINHVLFKEPMLVASVGASGGFDEDGRPSTYRRALGLIEHGGIEVASLITHQYESLEGVPRAFEGEHRSPDYVKGVVML